MKKKVLTEEEINRRTTIAEHMQIWLFGFLINGLILLVTGSFFYTKSFSLIFLFLMILPGILLTAVAIITIIYARYLIKNKKKK